MPKYLVQLQYFYIFAITIAIAIAIACRRHTTKLTYLPRYLTEVSNTSILSLSLSLYTNT